MKFSLFKNIKNGSVYVTPNFEDLQTKRFKFSLIRLLTYLSFYTALIIVLAVAILTFTPAKEIVLIFDNEKIEAQGKRIVELESRIGFLIEEIEQIASSNRKLRYAVMLAKGDTIDSLNIIYDSLRSGKNTILPRDGNIFKALIKLFQDDQTEKQFFLNPTAGVPVRFFNPSIGHLGLDYASKTGSPVYATSGGQIIKAGYSLDSGNEIIVAHKDGYISKYKHCSVLVKAERDYVLRGELIALSGNSGESFGPHLHFELWKDGKPVDPINFLINSTENN